MKYLAASRQESSANVGLHLVTHLAKLIWESASFSPSTFNVGSSNSAFDSKMLLNNPEFSRAILLLPAQPFESIRNEPFHT